MAPRLTTDAACRVAGFSSTYLNEAIYSKTYKSAPPTVRGRMRLFTKEDMIPLALFSNLLKDGFKKDTAGSIAQEIGLAANANPNAEEITLIWPSLGRAIAVPTDEAPTQWQKTLFSGMTIKMSLTYNIKSLREMISAAIEDESSIIGQMD